VLVFLPLARLEGCRRVPPDVRFAVAGRRRLPAMEVVGRGVAAGRADHLGVFTGHHVVVVAVAQFRRTAARDATLYTS